MSKSAATNETTSELTKAERQTIAKARILAGLRHSDLQASGTGDYLKAYVVSFTNAQHEITGLLDIIERLTGGET